MPDQDLGKGKPGHRPGRTGEQFLEKEHAAQTAEYPHLGVTACREDP